MKEITITTTIKELTFDELTHEQRQLVDAARDATYRSYAPYSHFRVGAAIELEGGEIITGANQENAAYPSGTCAERTACYYAHATHPEKRFKAIAIAARGTDGDFVKDPVPPCGACRQALLEYEKLAGEAVTVLLVARDRVYALDSIHALLPLAFADFE